MKKTGILILLCLLTMQVHAQLTEAEKTDLKEEAIIKLKTFMNYITIIGGKGNKDGQPVYDEETKNIAVRMALNLFKDDAMMEVSSYNRKQSKFYTLERYLYRLKDSLNYNQVNISFKTQALYFNENNLMKVPDAKEETYVATITVIQVFEATRSVEGNVVVQYMDEAKKNVEIIIKKKEDWIGQEWKIILGDVSVTETKKLG
jgi:hypothetical protein